MYCTILRARSRIESPVCGNGLYGPERKERRNLMIWCDRPVFENHSNKRLKVWLLMDQRSGYFSLGVKFFLVFIPFLVAVEGQWYKPWCLATECCNKRWILQDYDGVKRSLEDNLFGQHLVHSVVYASLHGHANNQPVKPLVLSFHGTTGTGKNYVSQWIAKNWFKKGMDSKFVHVYSGTKDFPLKSQINSYMTFLQREISSHTKSCGHQIFIFDEIDSFPPGLLNSIRSYLEYHENVDGVDYRNVIFLFLSNTGDSALKKLTEDFYRRVYSRESLKLAETERAMVSEIFNTEDTGLSRSRLIDTHLISHFVPFLPLERHHVRECIRRELRRIHRQFDLELVDDVMNELQFGGLDNNFSVKGCKNVAEKVNFVLSVQQYNARTEL